MIADSVFVASKRFDQGMNRGRTLIFENGLASRPLLLDRLPDQFSSDLQTRISLKLKHDAADKFLTGRIGPDIRAAFVGDDEPHEADLADAIGRICLSLDCDVF